MFAHQPSLAFILKENNAHSKEIDFFIIKYYLFKSSFDKIYFVGSKSNKKSVTMNKLCCLDTQVMNAYVEEFSMSEKDELLEKHLYNGGTLPIAIDPVSYKDSEFFN